MLEHGTMTVGDYDGIPRKRRRLDKPDAQPYVLKPLLQNVRLAEDDSAEAVHINCVEYWSMCIKHQYFTTADLPLL